jgi:hypothetical protein
MICNGSLGRGTAGVVEAEGWEYRVSLSSDSDIELND